MIVIILKLIFLILFVRRILILALALWTGYRSDVPYHAAPKKELKRLIKELNLKPGQTLVELGSGDGRFSLLVAKKTKAKVVAIEKNLILYWRARFKGWIRGANKSPACRQARINWQRADLFKTDLSLADAVYFYLLETVNEKLVPKLAKELKTGAKVASWRFPIFDHQLKLIKKWGGKHQMWLYEKT